MPREPRLRAGESAEHGASAQLERLDRSVGESVPQGPAVRRVPQDAGPTMEAVSQTGLAPAAEEGVDLPPELDDELNEGYDEELFAPSREPDLPVTDGVPFGPGADFIPRASEDDRSFMLRVARELEGSGIGGLEPYIRAIREGR